MLLEKVKQILRESDSQRKASGENFNIFFAANIWRKETTICRVLKEIIDVRGSNPVANICLKLFCGEVLQIDVDKEAVEKAVIVREKQIKNNRRIDLFLNIDNKAIPIEVKIYAEDQAEQCADYYEYAVNSPLYYLTLDCHEPSPESKRALTDEQIICISFRDHILRWLDKCLDNSDVKRIISVSTILKQLRAVIVYMTSQEGDKDIMDISNEICLSRENYRAAKAIEISLITVRIQMMKKVLGELSKHMEALRGKGLNCEQILTYETKKLVEPYYEHRKNTLPCIDYVFEEGKYNFRFEIWDNLYFGICKWNDEAKWNAEITADEQSLFKKGKYWQANNDGSSQYWYWWKYCFNKERQCNFRSCDGEYEKLFDENGFKEKMEELFSVVDECLAKIGLINP